jgi:hypothetical protein
MGSPRIHFNTITLSLLAVLLAAILQACASANVSSRHQPDRRADGVPVNELSDGIVPVSRAYGQTCCTRGEGTPKQEALAQAAIGFLGRWRIEVGGRRFTPDCAGLARGVYVSQDIDLYNGLAEPPPGFNGVRFIHQYVKQHGWLHYGPIVHVGDLVFFHNTWDFNRDGRFNDPLTHVGVVERIEDNGTVVFVSRVSDGVTRYRMNLKKPDTNRTADGRVLNDFMRRKGSRDPQAAQYLTGQLFAAFGTILQ